MRKRVEVYDITEDVPRKVGAVLISEDGTVETSGAGKVLGSDRSARWRRGNTPEEKLAAIAGWTNGYTMTTPILEGDTPYEPPAPSEEDDERADAMIASFHHDDAA